MTNFLKNDTEEGKNDPDRANAGKKRPLLLIGIEETPPLLSNWFQRNFDPKAKTRFFNGIIHSGSLSWLKCILKSILEGHRGCLIPSPFQNP